MGSDFTDIGGLMSYGANRNEVFRLAGTYAGKILQGMKAADLPMQAPTRYELVINLKAAKNAPPSNSSGAPRHRRRGDRMSLPCLDAVIAVSRGEGELLTVPKPRAVSLLSVYLAVSLSESRMPEIGASGSMSEDGKRSVAEWPKLPRPSSTLPKRTEREERY
jgi:hypothetical protein